MKRRLSRLAIIILIAEAAALGFSRRDLDVRNLQVFAEMSRSPGPGLGGDSSFFRDGAALRVPVKGTIPRGFTPYPFADTEADRLRAEVELLNPFPPSLDVLLRGHDVYRNFCRHCHGPTGQGDGPVGRKVPAFSMSIVGKATQDLPDGTLFHILARGQNNMPSHASQLSQADRWRVIHYLRDLQEAEGERLAKLGIEFHEDPRKDTTVSIDYGRELFETNCATCHGADGREPLTGVPLLNSARVLAIADEDYYLDIITHGRKGSEMPAWGKVLTDTQLGSLVQYVRSWFPPLPDRAKVSAEAGLVRNGRALFRGNCAACHGLRGEGGIGNSLNSASFLAMASDAFLRDTIALGRGHTAMPAGHTFQPEELSDLLALFRSWSPKKSTFQEVEELLPKASTRIGKKLYRARCASCHGKKGEGAIGPRLASESFLRMAEDRFLYRAIVEGRPGTAMPSWRSLESEDVADIIAFVRTWQKGPPRMPSKALRRGRAEFGELLYQQGCTPCHGPDGRGGVGNQIANPVFLSSASDEFLWRTIAHGKEDTAMRGFLKGAPGGALMPMGAADIEHVIAYLRLLEQQPRVDPPKKPRLGTEVELGRMVYEQKGGCAKCHGGQGQGASGPALGNPDFLRVTTDGYLAGTIVLGRENSEMLSFYRGGNVNLSPEEVEGVVAYVRSFEEKKMTLRRQVDRSPSSIAEGEILWGTYCAPCHGSDGRGPRNNRGIDGYAPSINNPEFLRATDDGFLLATISLGRPGTPMRPFARGAGGIADLSADEIRKIVAFIGSWEEEDLPPGPEEEER